MTTSTIGNTGVGSTGFAQIDGGYTNAYSATVPSNGTVGTMCTYIKITNNGYELACSIQCGLYDTSKNLLGASDVTVLYDASYEDWVTVTFSTPVAVTGGNTVLLAVIGEDEAAPATIANAYQNSGGINGYTQYDPATWGLPDPLAPNQTVPSQWHSIYAIVANSLVIDNSNIEWVSATGYLRQGCASGEQGLTFDNTSKRVEHYTYDGNPASHTLIYWNPTTKKLQTTQP